MFLDYLWADFSILFQTLYILQNESINGHYKNTKFICADVTSPDLKISDESVDLIFSNWLLMYLSDKEVNNLLHLKSFQDFKNIFLSHMFMFEDSFHLVYVVAIFAFMEWIYKTGFCLLLREVFFPCITGGESGRKNAKMVESWWIHFLQRILLPPVWRF